MDTGVLSSTEFRKRFAQLVQPTVVTVNGHAIGRWIPAVMRDDGMQYIDTPSLDTAAVGVSGGRIISRPEFRPVPKPSQRK